MVSLFIEGSVILSMCGAAEGGEVILIPENSSPESFSISRVLRARHF